MLSTTKNIIIIKSKDTALLCIRKSFLCSGLLWVSLNLLGCMTDPHTSVELSTKTHHQLTSRLSYNDKQISVLAMEEDKKLSKTQSRQSRNVPRKRMKDSKVISIKVEKLLVARGVKKRRAIGEARSFPANIDAVWSFAEVYVEGGTAELEMRWWREDVQVSASPFLVSERLRWREWSKMTIRPSDDGQWHVDVYDPSKGLVLASHHFNIERINPKEVISTQAPRVQESANLANLEVDQSSKSLFIERLEIAKQIKRRRPMGISSRFNTRDERLWGYIEVSNLHQSDFVWMEWYHGQELRSKLKVRVGISKRWRTWSWQRLSSRDQGDWTVKVLSTSGVVLKETHFVVE